MQRIPQYNVLQLTLYYYHYNLILLTFEGIADYIIIATIIFVDSSEAANYHPKGVSIGYLQFSP